ncbi:hypothetical protein B0A54_17236 [Friedmanniomyces endolithicus]|uniref:Elongator complex protein 5 n=1 Tax=Friedmanniomyces endolithicus TaxID=329885 RepID=A0A4U0TUT5_9PEZI|nr:hypothetical protein LTS09_011271 [Friedmanniomyces endolithicus]TKA26070.1 hypothetical protein B0A54_17236 [Friedmanniomyces endolithicus]
MTSTRSTIPPLLEPYLRLPPETSLILLTGTLGCSVSWVVSRFVGRVLQQNARQDGFGGGDRLHRGVGGEGERGGENADRVGNGGAGESGQGVDVVLVSWMRDLAFWKSEIRRGSGVDITKLMKKDADADEGNGSSGGGRFTFVDCFTTLSYLPQDDEDALLAELETRITAAITQQPQECSPTQPQTKTRRRRKVFLILDSPSLLSALSLTTASHLSTLLLRLRALPQIHSTLLTCPADLPLLNTATTKFSAAAGEPRQRQEVEVESAAFVVQQAGVARWTVGVRELETGAAGDVSGVLRVGRGGGWYEWDDEGASDGEEGLGGGGGEGRERGEGEVREMEVLYLVRRDGSARVFERGVNGL